jgi:adsorption protein B
MMNHTIWSAYLSALDVVAIVTAIVITISTLDDLTLDACYWSFEIRRVLRREKRQPSTSACCARSTSVIWR